MSLGTLLDVAAADARSADSRTGRNVTTAHATVAGALGCAAKTVQRARTVLEALGFSATVQRGRYLTTTERAAAADHHGGRQRRMASIRALVVPSRYRNVHLPRRGHLSSTGAVESYLPTRAHTRARAATRPKKTAPTRQSPPLGLQRLAASLARRLPHLARGHIGHLISGLQALNIDPEQWTATDIVELLDRRNVTTGRYSIPAHHQHHPIGLLMTQFRDAASDLPETPGQRRQRDAATRNAQATQDAAERRAAEERRTNQGPAKTAAITAARAALHQRPSTPAAETSHTPTPQPVDEVKAAGLAAARAALHHTQPTPTPTAAHQDEGADEVKAAGLAAARAALRQNRRQALPPQT